MHWVVTFKSIAGNVINSLNKERAAKFPGKSDEKVELVIENGCVAGSISEWSINAATFRTRLVEHLCGRSKP